MNKSEDDIIRRQEENKDRVGVTMAIKRENVELGLAINNTIVCLSTLYNKIQMPFSIFVTHRNFSDR